eukprot:3941480-Rhodomonas_salina.1
MRVFDGEQCVIHAGTGGRIPQLFSLGRSTGPASAAGPRAPAVCVGLRTALPPLRPPSLLSSPLLSSPLLSSPSPHTPLALLARPRPGQRRRLFKSTARNRLLLGTPCTRLGVFCTGLRGADPPQYPARLRARSLSKPRPCTTW